MSVNITYSRTPETWSEREFLSYGGGGYTLVFLNYNKGKLIAEAVRSTLGQDFPILEILFMDDASTDGSGEEMERLVRAYRGRHKVTVIRNKENRSIAGQWNVAARLATGRWLGMFCADDVAFADRVSVVDRILMEYPAACGICTNAVKADLGTTFCPNCTRGVWRGVAAGLPPENFFGAMTFWRKDVFDDELPYCNQDDYLIQWMVMIRRQDCHDVSLVWALDFNTVTYSLKGITNNPLGYEVPMGKSSLSRYYYLGKSRIAAGRRFGMRVWKHVIDYDRRFGHDGQLRDQINGLTRMYEAESGGWWTRLSVFLRVHTVERSCEWGGVRLRVVRFVDRQFIGFFFGAIVFPIYYFIKTQRLHFLKRIGLR